MYHPIYEITPKFLGLSSAAAELKAWIAQAIVNVTWLPSLQKQTAARLANASTSIEGNPLTLPEVEALAQGDPIVAATKEKQEVLNYLAAMRWIWHKKPKASISEKELLKLHSLLTQKTLPAEKVGRYKKLPNRVVDSRGHTVYTPPPPAQAKPLTQQLLSWINHNADLHPIILSAIAHHRLVSIHPFSDGNGRIARCLGIWLLYTHSFDTEHLFALDEYYERDRQKYYQKIQQARDLDDDLTYWLEYVAQGVVDTLHQTKERILSLQISAKAARLILTKRQEDFLRFLRDHGRVKSPQLEKAFQLTRARVGQILKPLIAANLVVREGHTRATTYRLN